MRVLIVGGGRGIGRAIAGELAARGHVVGLVARTAIELDEAVRSIRANGGDAHSHPADVLEPDALRLACRRFEEDANGPIDALAFAAGRIKAVGPLAAVDLADWWKDAETTLRGFAIAARELIPRLRNSPTPSLTALIGPGFSNDLAFGTGYGIAQAGLARLVESLAVELLPDTIPVYAVNPGLVPTDLIRGLIDDPNGRRWLPRFNEAFAEGKEVGPEVAAETVAWLVETRPPELSGRVVSALLTPDLLAPRMARMAAEDLGRLRLR